THNPPKSAYFNILLNEDISDEDYKHSCEVWEKLSCRNLGDYHDVYLKTDVCLLADVITEFRQTSKRNYNLDPMHYFSLAQLSLDAALLMTKKTIRLLTDYNMYLMFENGIRGGISQITKRYAEANNKYLPNFNPMKKSSFIIYLDANNLYGWAMSQFLPFADF
ncbi:hypothetical protein B4U79_02732, partial [Dinothrombium tinctorium]